MLDYEHSVLKEWEKFCKGYIEEGYEKRQPEVDALKKEVAEAEQRTAEAEQETVEAKQRADLEKARADKIEAERIYAREKIINNLTSIGFTPEQIANAINV